MKEAAKNHKFKVVSVSDNNEFIKQETLTIQEHAVEKQWKLLSNNIFNGNDVLSPGYFNNKTNFVIGDVRSIMGYNKQLEVLDNTSTEEMFKEDGYLLYPIPCFQLNNNDKIDFTFDKEVQEINLDIDLGYKIGTILAGKTYEDTKFLDLIIEKKNGLGLNKNFILNSNYEFVIGILKGYYDHNNDNAFYINNNVNLYTFSNILNYLGASYSIRNSKDRKKLFIQLPQIFEGFLENRFVKKNILPEGEMSQLSDRIKEGTVLMIPFKSISLVETSDNKMYDLTCERNDATNYALHMTPILKNSDGDILAASGIFTKEGLRDSKPFSPDHKEYYKNLNDGNINQWIADDAILGLYNATSHK